LLVDVFRRFHHLIEWVRYWEVDTNMSTACGGDADDTRECSPARLHAHQHISHHTSGDWNPHPRVKTRGSITRSYMKACLHSLITWKACPRFLSAVILLPKHYQQWGSRAENDFRFLL
jgi:hypothetical protein